MNILQYEKPKQVEARIQSQYVRPYLLHNLRITQPNQVWQTDISYIDLDGEELYLVAFIDVYSRYITGWGLFRSLKSEHSIAVVFRAIYLHSKPQIINTDQGSQYVCELWIRFLEREQVKISMNDPGRPTQNIYIERFWKTIKYDFIFRHRFSSIEELEREIGWFVEYYNYERTHKGIQDATPTMRYNSEKFIGAHYFYTHGAIQQPNMNRVERNIKKHIFDLYVKHRLNPEEQEGTIFLHFNQNEKPSIIVKIIDNTTQPLSIDELRGYYKQCVALAEKTSCWQFRLICPSGFTPECYSVNEFNIALSDNSYIQSLEGFYHLELFAHNDNTYQRVLRGFETSTKVAVVQATGTGKSLIISKLLLDNSDKQILVLAPSVYILDEIKKHLFFHSKKNLTFATYAKLSRAKDDSFCNKLFDYIVLDEFHRCGAPEWGGAILKLLTNNIQANVLGTSATPIRYLDGARNMVDEFFGGNVVQNITIARAIAQNILPVPKYISALYSFDNEYNRLAERINSSGVSSKTTYLRKLRELRSNWNKSAGVPLILKKHLSSDARKILVFCKNIEHLQKIRSVVSKWFYNTWSKRINIYELHSELNNKRVFSEFERQKDNELDILLVVDMLNEGIHTKGVDAIIMLRDTTSPNIYYQQLGRCMSVRTGYTPVIFDFVNNFEAIRVAEFVQEYELECLKLQSTRDGFDISNQKFIVFDEIKDLQELYNSLSNSIEKWEVKFEHLKEFFHATGHTTIPKSDKELYVWCNNQKQLKRSGKLEPARVEKLNQLNFRWQYVDNLWSEAYAQLVEFQKNHSHCRVPKSNRFLSAWVTRQRQAYRKGALSHSQINKLTKLSFVWEPKDVLWNKMCKRLEIFYQINGHSRVVFSQDNELHVWCSNVRREMKRGRISETKIKLLEQYQFQDSVTDALWNEAYQQLVQFKTERGHTMVPVSYNKTLASWVLTQRSEFKHHRLKPNRVKLLEEIGSVWNVEQHIWELKFEAMKDHLAQTKRNKPLVKNSRLYYWYKDQKLKQTQGKLSTTRLSRLQKIGLDI